MRLAVLLCALVCACRPPGYGKDKQPAPDAAAGGSDDGGGGPDGGAADAGTDAAPACQHDFRLDGHATSTSVWLTGDFIAWGTDPAHGAIPFTQGPDGGWTLTYGFPVGTYQYKFIVDDSQWIPDPTNPDTAPDGFGGTNSVYTCTP